MNFEQTYVLSLASIKGGNTKSSTSHSIATGINRGEMAFKAGALLRKTKLERRKFIEELISKNGISEADADRQHKVALRDAQRAMLYLLSNPPKKQIYQPLAIDFNDQASLTHL
jgi:hypothetical protein